MQKSSFQEAALNHLHTLIQKYFDLYHFDCPLETKYHLLLFGSYALGTNDSHSDIDVLLVTYNNPFRVYNQSPDSWNTSKRSFEKSFESSKTFTTLDPESTDFRKF